MTQFMFRISLLALLYGVSGATNEKVGIRTNPDYDAENPLVWHQTITIDCIWDVAPSRPQEGDVLTDDETSVWTDAMYSDDLYAENTEMSRVVLEGDKDEGFVSLTIKNITLADARDFSCFVPRIGSSKVITLIVLEPPIAGVVDLVAIPEFTTAAITFPAVEGATLYKVEYKASGEASWTIDAEIKDTTYEFRGLEPATTYNVRVSARNGAGIRVGIEPAGIDFTTKDNRPPKPVDDLAVSSAKYNDTSITIIWTLTSNTDVKHVISDIIATAGLQDGDASQKQSKTLAADATSATFELSEGPGTYEFIVIVLNDFSEGVDTSRTTTHVVKATTEPPVKPTTQPPKKTTQPPKKTTPIPVPDREVQCDGYSTVREVLKDGNVTLICEVPAGADYDPNEITWSYAMTGEENAMNQTVLEENSKIEIAYSTEAKQTQLTITAVSANEQGVYTCTEAQHSGSCDYTIKIKSTEDPDGGTASAPLGATISSILTLAVCLLAFY